MLALAKRLERDALELLAKGRDLEASFARSRAAGQTRVELTREQRARVVASTGAALDVLQLDGSFEAGMPRTSPATIERLAMASVAERALQEATRKHVEAVAAALLRLPDLPPETKAAVEAFRDERLRRS
jgi:hypothetical protein